MARPSFRGHNTVPHNLRLCRRPAHKCTRPASYRATGEDLHHPNERRLQIHRSFDPAGDRLQSRATHRAAPPGGLLPREPCQADHVCSAPRTALQCFCPMSLVPVRTRAPIPDRRRRCVGNIAVGCESRLGARCGPCSGIPRGRHLQWCQLRSRAHAAGCGGRAPASCHGHLGSNLHGAE